MPLSRLLDRLLGRRQPGDGEAARYADAESVERETQAHYRKVTGVDSSGRPTRPKDDLSKPSK